jgi:type II restriction enzyme
MKEKKGNKGEWSEIYVLLKLLGEGKLFAADADLNKLEEIFYPIISIFREESGQKTEYNINSKIKIIDSKGKDIVSLPIAKFMDKANELLNEIKKEQDRSFACPSLEAFLTSINCNTVAKGGGAKKDIEIKVHDSNTQKKPTLGFSIKSLIGGRSTLFNPGKTTNFTYELKFKNVPDIEKINSEKTSEILNFIKNNANIKFLKMDDDNFNNNLILIDSNLPAILSEMLINKYIYKISDVKKSVEKLEKDNPLKFPKAKQPFYTYKIKNFLTDSALGMTPAKVWVGKYDATGGIIIVKKDGEVVCYHIYNRNEFQDYLLNNTKFDQASTSRYNFGRIYMENNKYFIKLNLQVRFN